MAWTVLHIMGVIFYAASGALVAIEAEYSFIGIYVLGLTTAFGGAVIRNTIIGAPVTDLWDRTTLMVVLITLTMILFIPKMWTQHWRRRALFFDSIGLASFSIQGAIYAKHVSDHLGIIAIASMFTGVGGGMIRDLLAGRKPLALKEEIHAVLTLVVAFVIWLGWGTSTLEVLLLAIGISTLRMLSITFNFSFVQKPKRSSKLGEKR